MVAKFLDHNNRESFNGDGEQQKNNRFRACLHGGGVPQIGEVPA